MLKEFKEFAMKGSVVDLAVGVIIGAAFGRIVTSLVDNIINPILGLVVGRVDLSGIAVPLHGAVLKVGVFLNDVINFILVAFVIFIMVRQINKMRKQASAGPAAKHCPFCMSEVHIAARKCPHCTADLAAA